MRWPALFIVSADEMNTQNEGPGNQPSKPLKEEPSEASPLADTIVDANLIDSQQKKKRKRLEDVSTFSRFSATVSDEENSAESDSKRRSPSPVSSKNQTSFASSSENTEEIIDDDNDLAQPLPNTTLVDISTRRSTRMRSSTRAATKYAIELEASTDSPMTFDIDTDDPVVHRKRKQKTLSGRVSRACDTCILSHIRCDGGTPCKACAKKKHATCHYSAPRRRSHSTEIRSNAEIAIDNLLIAAAAMVMQNK